MTTTSQDPTTNESFLTVDDVGKRLKLRRMGVYELIRSGKLEAVRVGRLLRISRAAFADFMVRHSTKGRSA